MFANKIYVFTILCNKFLKKKTDFNITTTFRTDFLP